MCAVNFRLIGIVVGVRSAASVSALSSRASSVIQLENGVIQLVPRRTGLRYLKRKVQVLQRLVLFDSAKRRHG